MLGGFDLLTLNVEQAVKTKVMALRQLLQWSGYPAVVLLKETAILPPHFVFHCLYWNTFTLVTSSSAGVAILVRRDSQPHIGDFVHHPEGKAIVLELVYKGTPVQVVNVYMSTKGTAKEYCPLLQWLRPCGARLTASSHGRGLSVQPRVVGALCVRQHRDCPGIV